MQVLISLKELSFLIKVVKISHIIRNNTRRCLEIRDHIWTTKTTNQQDLQDLIITTPIIRSYKEITPHRSYQNLSVWYRPMKFQIFKDLLGDLTEFISLE